MPLLVYKAIKDDISKIQDTDDLVDKSCKAGAKILYECNTVGNHLQEDSLGFQKALEWLGAVFDGTYNKTFSSQGCTIRDITVTPPQRSIITRRRMLRNGDWDWDALDHGVIVIIVVPQGIEKACEGLPHILELLE